MSDNGVTDPSERTKYKAQVYDLALNAFFKLREFDSDSLQLSRAEVGWDIAEAFVAAAVSGVTYKSASPDRRFEAASLLRALADQLLACLSSLADRLPNVGPALPSALRSLACLSMLGPRLGPHCLSTLSPHPPRPCPRRRRLPQHLDLATRQFAPLAHRESLQLQRSKARPP